MLDTAVDATAVSFLNTLSKLFRKRERMVTREKGMPKRLDYRLKQVAELRQVGISTARCWRDSGNQKWFKALAEVEAESVKRKKKNERPLGDLH